MPKNDWNQDKELFLHEIKENGEQFKHIAEVLESLRADVATVKLEVGGLKAKAGVAGGVAGVIGTALVTFVFSLWK